MRIIKWNNNFLLAGLLFLVTLFSVGGALMSCSESEKVVTQIEEKIVYVDGKWMVVASKEVTVTTGETVTLNVTVGGDENLKPEYTCTSENPNIATVAVGADDKTVTVTGVSAGSTSITIECPTDTKPLVATIPVTVKQGSIRILAIGNSFSQDAVEQYLYELGAAVGHDFIIGNMYIGGCDLDKHLANLQSDAGAYEYRKVVKGEKVARGSYKLSQALADESWDYISLQQASGKSGKYDTYTALANLIAGINARCPQAKLMWHQTWAYASSSNHESFLDYDSDQLTMYNAIVSAARQAMTNHMALNLLIPSGTAIQNARTSFLGDAFNRDGYHLEVTYGRYTAACTWFEMITGQNVVGNPYAPETIDPQVVKIAQNAAHYAVQKPDEVTDMVNFKEPEISGTDLKAPIYIDFGPTSLSATPWNNITSHQESSASSWIKDAENNYTNIGVRVLGGFTTTYAGVSGEPASPVKVDGVEFPLTAWKDGLLVRGEKNQGDVGPGRIEISGLDAARKYNFTILAIRFNGSKDARISSYRLIGKTESETKEVKTGIKDAAAFTAANFEEYISKFENVEPDSDGKVIVEVKGLDTGSAAEGHINALCISLVK